eukprot:SAG11_NODE_2131_length_3777_cov_1.575041_2_plen_446_part_00
MQSDPFKTKAMRAMMRARTACVADGSCDPSAPAVQNFTRLLMKNGEHTWGKDVKTWLGKDQTSYMKAWSNGALATARRTKKNFQDMEASWHEQRLWGVGSALDALGTHPLAAALRAELAPPAGPPSVEGLELTSKRSFSLPGWSAPLAVAADGSLTSGGAKLAAFIYRSYSAVDVSNYDAQYRGDKSGSTSPECGDRDFCKPGMPGMKDGGGAENAKSAVWLPTLETVHYAAAGPSTRLVLSLNMSADCHANYGAPSQVVVSLNISGGKDFAAAVTILGKTATRLPEAAFVTFNPAAAGDWANEILGVANNATDVVPHGSQHLHASEAVSWQGAAGGRLRVESLDAGLLCYGEPTAFPTTAGTAVESPFGPPDLLAHGASWNLWNNLCGASYCLESRKLFFQKSTSPFENWSRARSQHRLAGCLRARAFLTLQVGHQLSPVVPVR